MEKITLKEALKQASVVDELKNFVGLTKDDAVGLMTPERLAAVAGEKIGKSMKFYATQIELNSMVDEVGLSSICEEVLNIVPDGTMFSLLVSCGNMLMLNGYTVSGKKYGFISVHSYNHNKGSFSLIDGILRKIS